MSVTIYFEKAQQNLLRCVSWLNNLFPAEISGTEKYDVRCTLDVLFRFDTTSVDLTNSETLISAVPSDN